MTSFWKLKIWKHTWPVASKDISNLTYLRGYHVWKDEMTLVHDSRDVLVVSVYVVHSSTSGTTWIWSFVLQLLHLWDCHSNRSSVSDNLNYWNIESWNCHIYVRTIWKIQVTYSCWLLFFWSRRWSLIGYSCRKWYITDYNWID